MSCPKLKLALALLILTSPLAYAATDATPATPATTDTKTADAFKNRCVEVWVEKGTDVTDKVAYKNFGEKFCACAVDKPLDNDAAINKTAQLCMSQTLLHDSMDTLSDEKGLANLNTDQIQGACVAKWVSLYPKMADEAKTSTTNFCSCSAPQLNDLVKKQNDVTDKQYSDQINTIADGCADKVKMDSSSSKS